MYKRQDLSDGSYYPLPKGALDYTVGDMIVFTSGSSTYRYYKLASGLRVYAGDISTSSQQVQDVVVNGDVYKRQLFGMCRIFHICVIESRGIMCYNNNIHILC